jgi:hypothetical protein
MSLLPLVNHGSANQTYYIENLGGTGDQPANAVPCIRAGDAFGAIRIADASAGMVIVGGGIGGTPLISAIRGGGAAGTTLQLGASLASPTNIVLTDAATGVNTNLTMGVGTSISAVNLSISGNLDMNQTQVVDNLRYQQAFNVADGTNDVALGTAQPALAQGSYAIFVSVTGDPQIQPSAIGFWNGAIWSGGANGAAFTYPGGNVAVGIRPAAGGATLVMSNGSGAAITGFVYYVSLGAN